MNILIYNAKKETDLRLLSLKKAHFILFSQEKIYRILCSKNFFGGKTMQEEEEWEEEEEEEEEEGK